VISSMRGKCSSMRTKHSTKRLSVETGEIERISIKNRSGESRRGCSVLS
jgi:hypothetical protein